VKSLFYVRKSLQIKALDYCKTLIVKKECTINQDIKAINSSVLEVNQFLYWYIKAYEKELLIKFAKTGTTVDRIVFEDFLKCIIPLPPLNVIKKINEKIHLLMKLYDQLNEEIEKSNQNLKLLTESVLKEAFQD
jgi:restriction endonuclease S subunit